jgi:hypothetical protein
VGEDDAAFSQEIRHIAEAEVEPEVQPDRVGDDLGWEAITVVGRAALALTAGMTGGSPIHGQVDNSLYNAP